MLCGPVSTGRRRPRRRRRLIACRLSKNAFIGRARSSLPEPEAKFDIDGLPCLRAHGANARMLDIPAPLRFFAEFKVENPHPCLSRPDFLGGDSDAGAPPRAQKQVWRPRYANVLWKRTFAQRCCSRPALSSGRNGRLGAMLRPSRLSTQAALVLSPCSRCSGLGA